MAARLKRSHRLRDPSRARSLPGTRGEDGSIVMEEIQQSLQRRKLSDHQSYAELRGNEIAALPRDRASMRTEQQTSRPPPRHVAMLNEIRGSLLPFANAEAIAQAEGAKGVDEEMLLALMDMGFDQRIALNALKLTGSSSMEAAVEACEQSPSSRPGSGNRLARSSSFNHRQEHSDRPVFTKELSIRSSFRRKGKAAAAAAAAAVGIATSTVVCVSAATSPAVATQPLATAVRGAMCIPSASTAQAEQDEYSRQVQQRLRMSQCELDEDKELQLLVSAHSAQSPVTVEGRRSRTRESPLTTNTTAYPRGTSPASVSGSSLYTVSMANSVPLYTANTNSKISPFPVVTTTTATQRQGTAADQAAYPPVDSLGQQHHHHHQPMQPLWQQESPPAYNARDRNVQCSPPSFVHAYDRTKQSPGEPEPPLTQFSVPEYAQSPTTVMEVRDTSPPTVPRRTNEASPGLPFTESYSLALLKADLELHPGSSLKSHCDDMEVEALATSKRRGRKGGNGDPDSVPSCTPQAFKFFMEQHVENVIKLHDERLARREQLERQMSKIRLDEVTRDKLVRILHTKESNYLRVKRSKLDRSQFEKIDTLGVGAFGEVALVRKVDDKTLFAMKTLRKKLVVEKNQVAHVKAERDLMAEADNEWVVKLFYSFQDKQNLYFIMEYIAGGDLMSLLMKSKDGVFPEEIARFYMAELILAIDSVHEMGFVHRDIKPDNVLIGADGHIKLTDFGLCTGFRWTHNSKYYQTNSERNGHQRQGSMDIDHAAWEEMKKSCSCPDDMLLKPLERKRRHQRCLAHSLVGTPNYIAPEILRHQQYGKLVDWWSAGVIFYEMIVGHTPFWAGSPTETQLRVIEWQHNLVIPRSENVSTEARDLIYRLLCEPEDRLGRHVDELKQHAFFACINWDGNPRDCSAPYIPQITHDEDTSNFDAVQPLRNGLGSVDDLSHNTNPAFYEFTFRRFELMPAHISSRSRDNASTSPSQAEHSSPGRSDEGQPTFAPSNAQSITQACQTSKNATVAPTSTGSSLRRTTAEPARHEEAKAEQHQPKTYNIYNPTAAYYPMVSKAPAVVAHHSSVLHNRLQPQTCHPPSFSPPLCPDSALATYV